MIDASDLIISKGQANFETLYSEFGDAFYLFVCKCQVIERITGEEFGNIMLLGGSTANEPDKDRGFSQFR